MLSSGHVLNGNYEEVLATLESLPDLYIKWWITLYHDSPRHIIVETSLILFLVWLIFFKKTASEKTMSQDNLPEGIKNRLIDSWKSEPLVTPLSEEEEEYLKNVKVNEGTLSDGRILLTSGEEGGDPTPCLNFASFNFLGLSHHPSILEESEKALVKYGCGSCGPRGFYGTIDVHLNLEEELARLFHVQQTITYSDGASTVSSAIPAFAKKGDVVIMDEECSLAIRTGVDLSRAKVITFKHNDLLHLEGIMGEIKEKDARNPDLRATQRRFIVVEALYRSTGDVCPLEQICRMKKSISAYLVVDESMSFGVSGSTGLGMVSDLREEQDWDTKLVDIHLFSLEGAVGSVGGVCVGEERVVDHQRLSGAGYCFSASTPPFLHAAAFKFSS